MNHLNFLSRALSVTTIIFAPVFVNAEPAPSFFDTLAQVQKTEVAKVKEKGIKPLQQGAWYSSGTLQNRPYDTTSEHETNLIELGNKDMWTIRPDYEDGRNHQLPSGEKTTTYLAREVIAATPEKVKVGIGSDDGFVFFLNGTRVAGVNRGRGVTPDDDVFTLDLKKGTNVLLFKIVNNGGASGFYYKMKYDLPTVPAWNALSQQFPEETASLNAIDASFGPKLLMSEEPAKEAETFVKNVVTAQSAQNKLIQELGTVNQDLESIVKITQKASKMTAGMNFAKTQLRLVTPTGLMAAVNDLEASSPGALKNVPALKAQITALEKRLPELLKSIEANDFDVLEEAQKVVALQREIMFANPALIKLDDVVLVRRSDRNLGLTYNWQGNTSMGKHGYDNELGVFSLKTGKYKPFYRPTDKSYVGDIEMHFDGEKLLFSGIKDNHWQIFEIGIDGKNLRQVTTEGALKDVDNYEAMYLPDEKIIFTSSSTFVGVPCVSGSDYVGNIHRMNADGTDIRRLCFDQDNNWCPVLLEDGRILYLRWEYTDSAHYFSRVLMTMNPDGTGQKAFYGSNSYWPNSMFYARPLPGSTNKYVAVVTGHHGVQRMGELYVFDVAKGRTDDEGVVQQLKAHYSPSSQGKIADQLVNGATPFFLHPHPVSDKLFIVSAKPRGGQWGLYLIDTFNNMTLLTEEQGYVYFEPNPVEKRIRPPVIPDKTNMKTNDATLMIQDIYEGEGLRGVPRGTIKGIRVYQYEYSYRDMGGHYTLGMEAGWDVRRLIGTVPVFEDGSAIFKVPANVPLCLQPIDAEGKAVQHFRSWLTAMPGEYLQCIGCHESQNQAPLIKEIQARSIDREKAPFPTPFYGQKRGFSFEREVQPVLNRYCVSCHNGANQNIPDFSDTRIDIAGAEAPWQMTGFSYAYNALHPYVRRNGGEGDWHVLVPGEFHANTSPLVQILRKGHHGVEMDKESWDRINTWIDLNVPFYGTWAEVAETNRLIHPRALGNFEKLVDDRKKAREMFASVYEDIEAKTKGDKYDETPVLPKPKAPIAKVETTAKAWPFDSEKATAMVKESLQNGEPTKIIDLGNGQKITFVRIPAGEFNMGSDRGFADEQPVHTIKIDKPFWMATTEISLAQYQAFDSNHKNGFYDQHYKDQVRPGYDMDKNQNWPAMRLSWIDAMDYCKWLSEKSHLNVTLPSEAQWEWAARAGSDKPFSFGDLNTDFSKYGNFADRQMKKLAVQGVDPQPMRNPNKYFDYEKKDERFDDGYLHLAPVDHYQANAFGLKNMNGNVAEWTRSSYRPYPFIDMAQDVKLDDPTVAKTLRGGSWYERPKFSTSSIRMDYPAWRKVYNSGFRPIIEE